MKLVPTWAMARTAVANDRRDQFRMPGVPLGLVGARLVRPSAPGDFERQLAWLRTYEYFGLADDQGGADER